MLPAVFVTLYAEPIAFAHTFIDPVITEVAGASIVTGRFTAEPIHNAAFVSITLTLAEPATPPQSTVILFEFVPLACTPPVIVQE